MMEKAIPPAENDVAARIAQRTLVARSPDYLAEVRTLLDAGRAVMRANGTRSRARVADIVTAAGLSNEAFYRHFPSKDALVAAILEDGTERLQSYLAHQMEKETDPERQVRRWVEGVLAQAADDEVAATTLAVLWNAGTAGDGRSRPASVLARLVRGPFEALGSPDPELDASLAAHGLVGRLHDHLWQGTRPTPAETERLVAFYLAGVGRDGKPSGGQRTS